VTGRMAASEAWVSHTHEVEAALGDLRSDMLTAETARLRYIFGGVNDRLAEGQDAINRIQLDVQTLKRLTADNPAQQRRIGQLQPLLERKVGLLQQSIALRRGGKPDKEVQEAITARAGDLSKQISDLLTGMQKEEEGLLASREVISRRRYSETRVALIVAFVMALAMLFVTFRQALNQLRDRRRAEEAVRRLSGRLLQLQDAERRKVARELHDGVGQYFSALAMCLDGLNQDGLPAETRRKLVRDCVDIVQRGGSETRTLSHLLHPPLLDEAGLASAAKWYVDGYRERSKIDVNLELAAANRMPKDVELALFRVLQEGLTNIHRHSGSRSARVQMSEGNGEVTLLVQDFGKGIPESVLEQFRVTSTGTGVGLAGMRERIAEMGGVLEIESGEKGTTLRVKVPIAETGSSSDLPRDENPQEPGEVLAPGKKKGGGSPLLSLLIVWPAAEGSG
ncbi:MAG TPA: CHASE3 domain-containing protein, partial [Terriglobales bacterium]